MRGDGVQDRGVSSRVSKRIRAAKRYILMGAFVPVEEWHRQATPRTRGRLMHAVEHEIKVGRARARLPKTQLRRHGEDGGR